MVFWLFTSFSLVSIVFLSLWNWLVITWFIKHYLYWHYRSLVIFIVICRSLVCSMLSLALFPLPFFMASMLPLVSSILYDEAYSYISWIYYDLWVLKMFVALNDLFPTACPVVESKKGRSAYIRDLPETALLTLA